MYYDRDMRVGVMSLIGAEKFIGDIFETLTLTGLSDGVPQKNAPLRPHAPQ